MRLLQFMIESVPILLGQYLVIALRYEPDQVGFNLNQNATATDPLDYWGEWENHTYFPSPENWRIPFYTLFIDRFVNGDPSNDDANGTKWEHDVLSNQLRHGGDVLGLRDSFDYLQGMGVKVGWVAPIPPQRLTFAQAIYIAGTPHINAPWASDAYSPLDLTLLDYHFGNIDDWREMISDAHQHGIYIILENTMAT
jgi:alpha-1,3-glucan synthase